MKIRELADYCKSININCDECIHKKKCDNWEEVIAYATPVMIVDMVDKNKDVEDELKETKMKHKKITTGNYNCNRSLVNESFFKALDAFIPNDIKGKTCYIDDDYIYADNLFYDNRIQKVISEDEWEKIVLIILENKENLKKKH